MDVNTGVWWQMVLRHCMDLQGIELELISHKLIPLNVLDLKETFTVAL